VAHDILARGQKSLDMNERFHFKTLNRGAYIIPISRIIILLILLSYSALIAGCNSNKDNWKLSEYRDDLNNFNIINADLKYIDLNDRKSISQISISCKYRNGYKNQLNLSVNIGSYQIYGFNKYRAAPILGVPAFRIEGMSSPRWILSLKDHAENQFSFPVYYMSMGGGGALAMESASVAGGVMGAAEQFLGISPQVSQAVNSASYEQILQATDGFKLPSGRIFLTYATDSGSKRALSFSLDDPTLLKVAEACGWSTTGVEVPGIATVDGQQSTREAATAPPTSYPALTGRVVDAAQILSPQTEGVLFDRLKALEATSGAQVVVVTIPDLKGRAIEEYGRSLGSAWGVGDAKRNDGVLLIVAPNERRVRIEVGRGLEKTLSNKICENIINETISPEFRKNNYDAGVLGGISAIAEIINANVRE
jgi:hypothetical protein